MKSLFLIDDNGRGMEDVRRLLRENGYSVTELESGSDHGSEFYRFALDRACVQAFCIAKDRRIMYVNDSACRALGYTREELTRMSIPDIDSHFPAGADLTFAEYWNELREKGNARFDTYHRARDGRVYPVEIHSNFFEFGGMEYTCAFVTDISDRRRAEEQLKLHEFCIEKASIGIYLVSSEGEIVMANERACRRLGYSADELRGKTIFDIDPLITWERISELKEALDRLGAVTHESVHRRKDGTTYPVEIYANYVKFQDGPYTVSFVKDISERRNVEEALRKSEEKFRLLTESSPNGIILIQNERILYANPTAVRMSGYARENLSGMEFWQFVHEDFREVARARALARQQGAFIPDQQEYRLVTLRGEDSWVLASSVPMEYEDEPAVMVTFVDITETKRAREALRESEARLKMAMEIAKLAQWEYDAATGMFLHFDDQFLTLYGLDRNGKYGKLMSVNEYIHKFVHPDDIPLVMTEIEQSLSGMAAKTGGQIEHRTIGADGEERIVAVRYRVLRDREGRVTGLRGAHQDVTEIRRAELKKKNLEAQLYQAQKMEAVGQFAGGIAHDFSNILTAIMGFAEIMVMRMEENNPFQHYARQILASAERAADLTHGLLAFSRKQGLKIMPFDLREVVDGFRKMLRRLVPEDIELRMKSSATGITVMADRGQIEQVLMNLVTNARDAMPIGGILTIDVGILFMDDSFCNNHGFGIPGRYAGISVEDTGCGMDEKTRERIFEPFFTTKTVGKGTGLGLSIVYGIVKQHKGFVTVGSSPGNGTTVNVYLPLVEQERQALAEEAGFESAPGGTETILLAEDDELVRCLNRTILEEAGYSVVEASDGQEALHRFMELRSGVDMLVTDVIMPNMDGKMLYEEIRKVCPGMKVLFMSGYSPDFIGGRDVFSDDSNFMAKPAKPTEFLKKLREIIDVG